MIPKSHSVHHLPFCRGVEPSNKFSKKRGGGGGLDRTSTFRGGLLGKRGVTFFKAGGWTVCRIIGGLGKKEGDGVFEGGLIPQCAR